MPKALLILPVLATLAGCAAPAANLTWKRADVTPQAAAQDSFECKQTARVTAPEHSIITAGPASWLVVSAISGAKTANERQQVYDECMAARGYNAQPAAP